MNARRAYLRLYRGSEAKILVTTAAIAVQAAFGLPIAWLLKRLLDGGNPAWETVATSVGAIVLLYVVGDALLLFAAHRNLTLVKQAVMQLRNRAIVTATTVRIGVAREHATGVLQAGLIHDTERVDEMSSALLSRVLPAVLSLAVLFAVLASLDGRLLFVTLLTLPLAWVATAALRRGVGHRIAAFHGSQERYSAGVLAILQQIDLAIIHGTERIAFDRHARLADDLRGSGHAVAWAMAVLLVAQNETAVLTTLAIVLAGHVFMAAGTMTLGTLLAFYVVLAMTRSHLNALVTQIPSVIAGVAAFDRLHATFETAPVAAYRGADPVTGLGEIRLAGVTYGYGADPLFANLDLTIARGRIQGLAGPNGAGKTTLIRLILGLARPIAGNLHADKLPYDTLDLATLRRHIAFVPQDPVLFAGSLHDNLVFGLDTVPDARTIEAALDMAGAHFVAGLDDGLESWLGDGGVRLSGGQRQRLSLARAFLRKPALLILDEPTNHIGTADARAILRRFRDVHRESAVLLVSHDPEIMELADSICTLGPAQRAATAA